MFTSLKYSKVADFIGTQMMVEIDAWIEAFFSVRTDTGLIRSSQSGTDGRI